MPAAYGDLIAMVLAFAATLGLRTQAAWAFGVTWVFNLWGTADLLYAFYDGNVVARIDPGMLGAAFFIPTVLVQALLVAHVLTFQLLLQRQSSTVSRPHRA